LHGLRYLEVKFIADVQLTEHCSTSLAVF